MSSKIESVFILWNSHCVEIYLLVFKKRKQIKKGVMAGVIELSSWGIEMAKKNRRKNENRRIE